MKAFYAIVRCPDCREEVKVRIDSSSDFQAEFSPRNPEHSYTVKKEIIGKNCFNLMQLILALTKDAKVLFTDAVGCEFLKFGKDTD